MATTPTILNQFVVSHADGSSHLEWVGRITLATGGGTETITVTGAQVGDFAYASLESDDSGTSITEPLIAKVTAANTLTITRTDDGSSSDDAVCVFRIVRPA